MSHQLLPPSFLFRFAYTVRHLEELPAPKGQPLSLPDACRLPTGTGLVPKDKPFAELRLAWNSRGLGLSLTVTGKKQDVKCDPNQPASSDGLTFWIDTRNTQNIHRASRFCHMFVALPGGDRRDKSLASIRQIAIARAREEAAKASATDMRVTHELLTDGYRLDVWLAADALQGYDPESSPRLGFYYHVRDRELGDQFLGVDQTFPFDHDPSLWATLELQRS